MNARLRAMRRYLAAAAIAATALGAAPPATADPMSDLIATLPPGYAPDSCHGWGPTGGTIHGLITGLECSGVQGQVPMGRYLLFADAGDASAMFDGNRKNKDAVAAACPGMGGSGVGSITGGSGWSGKLACGANDGAEFLMWTHDRNRTWNVVMGPDLPVLVQWFNHVVGPS